MPDYCGGDFQYIGTHDVLLFHLKKALPEQALKELEVMIWGYGVENIVIGMFQQLLHYCTRNSCKILGATISTAQKHIMVMESELTQIPDLMGTHLMRLN